MYLAGEFGNNPTEVNPLSISTMYAIDRYASFKTDWEKFYKEDGVLVTDRYTTSNMVHQASKIEDKNEKLNYLKWLEEFEYNKMGIPKPDLVIFPKYANTCCSEINGREKITGEEKKDIHEADEIYLEKSHSNACEVSKIEDWSEILCVDGDRIKTVEEINNECIIL